MKSSSVLIVGCGDLGIRAGCLLADQDWVVTGMRRNVAKLPVQINARPGDYTLPGSLDFAATLAPDFVLATFNPPDRSTAGYVKGFQQSMANLLSGLGEHRPQCVLMASSTRVFAESEGGWVDEESALSSDDPWAEAIIESERQLLDSGHRASVVRFAGIYGIPGGRLLSRVRRGELCPPRPLSYTNRIHREDCAGFLAHLLQQSELGAELEPVYIGVDDHPSPRYAVESWLALQMGVAELERALPDAASDPTRHNRAGHKRCLNRKLRDSGYQLIYPDYKAGYSALLALHDHPGNVPEST